jgi:cobalt-zinc-cadmium efflux system outer membrane protein
LELATARLRRAVSQAGIRIAGQLPNPSIIFNAARDTPHESLLFDQQFDINGKRHRRVELAQQQDALIGLDVDMLVRQVRRRVRAAFYAAARSHSTTVYQKNTLSLAQRVREIAQSRFDAGEIPQLEVLQADLEVARTQTEFTIAQQREKLAASDLNLLLNEPGDKVWDLGSSLEAAPPAFSLKDLITRAYATNADLIHLAQEVKVEEARLRSLRAERIPSLGIQAGVDFNSPAGAADPVTGSAGGFKIGGRGQLTVPVPIFTRNQGEIAQSFATSRVLESQIATSRRAVSGRVAAVYYEWSTRQSQVEMYWRTLLPAAQRLENMMEESYRAGRANLLNVLDAQRNVQQVQRDYLDSLLALQNAFADLEEVVGVPLD